MKYIKLFDSFKKWYRGYTTNTKSSNYVWLTSSKQQAEKYAEMNQLFQGGESIVDEMDLDLSSFDILDVTEYDMDDKMKPSDINDFLTDINIDFDYLNLFDAFEEEIPLSRLVNNILYKIFKKYTALKIMEDGIETVCIYKPSL